MTTITTKNYFERIKNIGFENLPQALQESHEAIAVHTNNGKDWKALDTDDAFRSMSETAFEKLEDFIGLTDQSKLGGIREEARADTKIILQFISVDILADYFEKGYTVNDLREISEPFATDQVAGKLKGGYITINQVEDRKAYHKFKILEIYKLWQRFGASKKVKSAKKPKHAITDKGEIMKKSFADIDTEVGFIQRFLGFHDKILYKNTFGIFLDELKVAIDAKRITKKSPVANEIMEIQEAAVKQYNKMAQADHFVLRPETIKRLKNIIVKWENSFEPSDEEYIKSKKKPTTLQGIPNIPKVNVMPSTDFAKLEFNTIGFKDPWKAFIGDPAPGFTAMVFGMPKMGKSYLCVDFAGYLARNHGRVLYIAREEKLDKTLQDKLNEKEVAHPNLTVADGIPEDLSPYEFVFLDSVNKLGQTARDLEKLKANNKGKSFIYIFQATKAGRFKGNNEFQHDVDVVIEVPERGKAIQFGRFNQGGAMDIFADNVPTTSNPADDLNGLDGKKEDWTTPKYLNSSDHALLKEIKKYVDQGEMSIAMSLANSGDTMIREEIPGEIWLKMGGSLTPSGLEKLKKRGFTAKELKKLQEKDDSDRDSNDDEPEETIREISLLPDSKVKYLPPRAEIYRNVERLSEINYALQGLRGNLESMTFQKFKVAEYLDIVKIAVRKHPDLFAFTEDVSDGLKEILFRLKDSWEDWKNGVTPNTVKIKVYKPRKGLKTHFTPSPGLNALATYYDKNVASISRKKFDDLLTTAVERDDLLYYSLHDLERVFARVIDQMKKATKA
ncbi:MAG: hypothetical protein ACJ77K_06380 [Bacteroidia bacterium]